MDLNGSKPIHCTGARSYIYSLPTISALMKWSIPSQLPLGSIIAPLTQVNEMVKLGLAWSLEEPSLVLHSHLPKVLYWNILYAYCGLRAFTWATKLTRCWGWERSGVFPLSFKPFDTSSVPASSLRYLDHKGAKLVSTTALDRVGHGYCLRIIVAFRYEFVRLCMWYDRIYNLI